MKIFEEGYDKDYIYEERKNIPLLQVRQTGSFNITSSNIEETSSYITSSNIGRKNFKQLGIEKGKPRPLLTMRGAIKFNASKRTEGGKIIAFALIERDDLMITEKKKKKKKNKKNINYSEAFQFS